MKIIFITREGYDLAGARIRCYMFANELKKNNVDAEVFSFSDNLGSQSGVNEYKLRIRDKIYYNLKAFNILKRKQNSIFFINRLNYHSFAPWIYSLLKGNKIVFDMDDWEIRENPEYYFGFWPGSKAEFLTNKLARKANCCFGASKFLVNYLSLFNKHTYYLPSGINTEIFKPRKKFRYNSRIIFSWIGTMHRKADIENIRFIIECFSKLKERHNNIALEITGDGIYRSYLRYEESKLKDVDFKGWIHPDNIPDYLENVSVGLMPLIQDTKFNRAKSPVKLFEYMAMGKPTVSSNIGETFEIIENGKNGFLASGEQEFIKKMEYVIENFNLINSTVGEEARKTITKNYSLSVLIPKLISYLENCN